MAGLFDIPKRPGKSSDLKLAKKVNSKTKTATTVRGGSSIIDRIATIKAMVDRHLGKYTDEYIFITDEQELSRYIDSCIKNNIISIDTETTGLDPMLDDIAGICIYTPGEKGAYIPLNHVSYVTRIKIANQLSLQVAKEQFQRIADANIDIIMFNAKFDTRFMYNQVGVKLKCTWDGYLAGRLLNENEPSKGLKKLHQKYILHGEGDAFSFDELFKGMPFTLVPINIAYLYAAHDPVITYELYEFQKPFLTADNSECIKRGLQGVAWVFHNIEMPCVQVVSDMEDNGITFDNNYAHELSVKYNQLLIDKEKECYDLLDNDKIEEYVKKHPSCKLDNPLNIASPTQLAIYLYDILQVESVDKKTPRGTGVDILQKLNLPICNAILEYRAVSKLLSTYIDKLPDCVNPNDGRIHCSFNQYGADTGRFSSSDPNLQNIPSHNKDIRKMFTASEGYVLMSSDFSQQEPKCLAALCRMQGDPQMYNTFMEGKDLYSEIAAKAFNVPYEECLEFRPDGSTNKEGKARRTQAKSILLGVLYGRGVPSIAEQLKCSVDKAQKIKDSVFKGFPAIKQFEETSLQMGMTEGFVTTICGRKRRLPDLTLDEFEFRWKDGAPPDDDILNFTDDEGPTEIPDSVINHYLRRLSQARFGQKRKIFEDANKEGIWIVDNGAKIADAQRQCVNARIQGSAADLTKLAMIDLAKNEHLKELGFKILVPVHDEIIAECPEENAKECSKLLAETMSKAAQKILEMPISCDVEVTREWYGEEVKV